MDNGQWLATGELQRTVSSAQLAHISPIGTQ